MKNNKHLKWLVLALISLFYLLVPASLTAATNRIHKISQITKNTPLILQHASTATNINTDHDSHVSHESHASHASHASHYSGE